MVFGRRSFKGWVNNRYSITKLEKNIIALQKEIFEKIRYINSGGCIHFAYYMAKKLEKLNIPYNIIFIDMTSIVTNLDCFKAVDHVVVYVKEIGFFDGTDLWKNKSEFIARYDGYYITTVSNIRSDDLKVLTDYNFGWNKLYKIENNILLEQLIDKHLK